MLTDRLKNAPRGLMGGNDGAKGRIALESGRPLQPKGLTVVQPGDCIIIQTPGGGGYGDPRQRDTKVFEQERGEGLWAPSSQTR
jgi:N-methylhydantoinase B